MLTVRLLADRYGVSTSFAVQALAKIGFNASTIDSVATTAAVARFEAEFGEKIRAARPTPAPAFAAESDTRPTASRDVRQPKPHVMRVAHSKVTSGRDAHGLAEKRLLTNPDRVHAIDAAGTRDGDPWSGEIVPGAVHFYDGASNTGPPAACGWVKVRAVLGEEFVPADGPAKSGQCSLCAEIVSNGRGFRATPQDRIHRSPFCEDYLRIRIDGRVAVKDCSLRDFHGGTHRARDGSEWEIGVDDYVPAPDELGRRITKAS